MKRFGNPTWVLVLIFLAIIAIAPLVQTAMEATEDDGIQALQWPGGWPSGETLRAYEKKLETANWASRVTRPWLQFANFKLKEGGEKVVVGAQGWYFFKPGLNYMVARHNPATPVNATNDPVSAIVNFRDQLADHGVRLLVMPVPNKESIYPDRLNPQAQKPRGVLTPRTREVLEKLRAHNVEVVDLFKEFSDVRQQGGETPLYLEQDTHWSPNGVALAARTVARRLSELGWVQPARVEYMEHPQPVQRLGDILRMLQTPMIERRVAPENVPAIQVLRAADSKPYVDEATAEVLILGDSFMRIYQTDTPKSAGFIAHLAKELKQPMMSLVNDGGGSTLVREELSARPIFLKNKKVVVWEFVERDIGLGIKGWRRTSLPPASPSN